MKVEIVVTKKCVHRKLIENELNDLGVKYKVIFVEDNPDIVSKYSIRHSPNIILNNDIVCRELPSESELKKIFNIN